MGIKKLQLNPEGAMAMKFRDYDVKEVKVIEDCDMQRFLVALSELMEKEKLIDLQYSTRHQLTNGRLVTTWSALVLIGR